MVRKVLLVQLDQKNLEQLADYFHEQGDLVWTASSLKEAGIVVRRERPDLILMDIGIFGKGWQEAVPQFSNGSSGATVLFTANGGGKSLLGRNRAERNLGVLRPPFTEEKIETAIQHRQNGASPGDSEKKDPSARRGASFPIRFKITLPYIGLALALAMAAAYVVTNVILDTIEERFTNQLIETGRLTAEWMVKEEGRLLESLRLIAHTQGLSEAVEAADAETLREITLPIAVNAAMESMEILDTSGVGLLSLRLREGGGVEDYYASRGDTAYQEWVFVQAVLAGIEDDVGDKFAGVAQAPWGDFFYVAGPILNDAEELAGVVLVGKSMATLTQEIREATVAQATVYSFDGQPLATTLLEQVEPLSPELATGVLDRQIEESFLRNLNVANIAYSEILTTMEARGGVDIGIVGTALPQTFLVQPSKVTRMQIFGLATLAFILVIAAGVLVSDRITRPLLQVVQASSEVAKGNLTVQVKASGNDELATLAHSFNEMVTSLQRSNRELMEAYNTTLEGWSKALELRDEDTEGHTQRVTDMTVVLARRMGFSDDELIQIRRGALLHDIGKMGIPDRILNKPGPLSEDEWIIMRKHPIYAYQMLSPIEYLRPALAIPCCHHERWDGSGYPLGWRRDDIPLPARIFAAVDVWDALRSDRPYREAWSEDRVLDYLQANRSILFDPEVVDEFVRMVTSGTYQDPVLMQTPAMHMATLRKLVPFG